MKQPMAPIPGPFRALIAWLRDRRGLDLFGRINFTRGFYVGGIEVTADDVRAWKDMIGGQPAKKNPRNKHPAEKEEDSVDALV